jgi:hypothetical protein
MLVVEVVVLFLQEPEAQAALVVVETARMIQIL